jgi:hypothetical protein
MAEPNSGSGMRAAVAITTMGMASRTVCTNATRHPTHQMTRAATPPKVTAPMSATDHGT